MIIPIQIILIALLVAIVAVYFRRIQSHLYDRIVLVAFITSGILMVLFPDMTTTLAHLMGVGRGADLVLYIGLLGLAFGVMIGYINQRELKSKMTELARAIAIQQAVHPNNAVAHDDEGE